MVLGAAVKRNWLLEINCKDWRMEHKVWTMSPCARSQIRGRSWVSSNQSVDVDKVIVYCTSKAGKCSCFYIKVAAGHCGDVEELVDWLNRLTSWGRGGVDSDLICSHTVPKGSTWNRWRAWWAGMVAILPFAFLQPDAMHFIAIADMGSPARQWGSSHGSRSFTRWNFAPVKCEYV